MYNEPKDMLDYTLAGVG